MTFSCIYLVFITNMIKTKPVDIRPVYRCPVSYLVVYTGTRHGKNLLSSRRCRICFVNGVLHELKVINHGH